MYNSDLRCWKATHKRVNETSIWCCIIITVIKTLWLSYTWKTIIIINSSDWFRKKTQKISSPFLKHTTWGSRLCLSLMELYWSFRSAMSIRMSMRLWSSSAEKDFLLSLQTSGHARHEAQQHDNILITAFIKAWS